MTAPVLASAGWFVELPGETITTLVRKTGELTGLFDDGRGLGMVMSALSGAAAALAVALAMVVYFHAGHRTSREVVKDGIAATAALALIAFVAYDMRHATFAYLGLNPSQPEIEFEVRVPKADLSTTQIELHTDLNQQLAQVQGAADTPGGESVLRGVVTLDYRTTDRVVFVRLPGGVKCEFRLRLVADPSRSEKFGPWHLADRVELPAASNPAKASAHDAFAIRYRVL